MRQYLPLPAILLVLTLAAPAGAAQGKPERKPFFRNPSVNHDGSLVAFCYRGDVWTARPDGSNLRRFASHVAYDTYPAFSPDGKHLAWSADRKCGMDIFVMALAKGHPRRLTFH
jgi:tricorn protease